MSIDTRTARIHAFRRHSAAGFTLIELLIVLALISILASMGVVQYQQRCHARKRKRASHGPLPHARRD